MPITAAGPAAARGKKAPAADGAAGRGKKEAAEERKGKAAEDGKRAGKDGGGEAGAAERLAVLRKLHDAGTELHVTCKDLTGTYDPLSKTVAVRGHGTTDLKQFVALSGYKASWKRGVKVSDGADNYVLLRDVLGH